jgi:ornithine cyclodeaminase
VLRRLVDMPAAIDAMGDAFRQISSGAAHVPLRTGLETPDGIALFMPAWLAGSGALGAKTVTVFGANTTRGLPAIVATVLVLDPTTGAPRALLEGSWLTALRTGAASGLATRHLARPDASVLAVFGAGVQARTQIEAVRCVRRIREVRIVAPRRERAERLRAELLEGRHGAPGEGVPAVVTVVADPRAAVAGADVIVAATTSRTPVCPGDAIEPGTHVNGVGSFTPEMCEMDERFVLRARVFVDSRATALAEAGELIQPIRSGRMAAAHIQGELGEIVAGTVAGRRTPDEITYFKSVGNAAQDLVVAARAVDEAERRQLGTVVDL